MDLSSRALVVAAAIPRPALDSAALAAVDESAGRADAWFVGFSGGADSLALLLLVWAHWPEQRGNLRALHFNHRLRGAESDGDETFCTGVCHALSIPLVTGVWREAPVAPSEDEARKARHTFFEEAVRGEKAATLFTGHHLDDVVETLFMRSARGATAAGLAAPRAVRRWLGHGRIVRPLLSLTKEEILGALRRAELTWRDDSTNAGTLYLRNRIRHTVVPAWLQAVGVSARQGVGLTRRWLEEDDEALEWWLDQLGFLPLAQELDLEPLAGKPRALWRRAVRRWAPAASLARQAFEALLAICESGSGRISVGEGFGVVEHGRLRFEGGETSEAAWGGAVLLPETTLLLPSGGEVTAAQVSVGSELRSRIERGAIDSAQEAYLDVPISGLTARSWQPGDRFRPLGAPGSGKLQDLFTNRKVRQADRRRIPVICSSDGLIVWVPGMPPADHCKLTQHSVTAVQLTYRAGTSTVRKQS